MTTAPVALCVVAEVPDEYRLSDESIVGQRPRPDVPPPRDQILSV